MPWVRFDDQFLDHPKIAANLSPLGIAMQFAGVVWSARNLTNGIIPDRVVPRLLSWQGIAVGDQEGDEFSGSQIGGWYVVNSELGPGAADMWHDAQRAAECPSERCHEAPRPKDNEMLIHDYLAYQPSREEVLADRATKAAARSAAGVAGGKARAAQAIREAGRFTSESPASDQREPASPPASDQRATQRDDQRSTSDDQRPTSVPPDPVPDTRNPVSESLDPDFDPEISQVAAVGTGVGGSGGEGPEAAIFDSSIEPRTEPPGIFDIGFRLADDLGPLAEVLTDPTLQHLMRGIIRENPAFGSMKPAFVERMRNQFGDHVFGTGIEALRASTPHQVDHPSAYFEGVLTSVRDDMRGEASASAGGPSP